MSLSFCVRVPEYEIASTKLLIVQNCQKNEGMILKYEGFFSQFYAIINSTIWLGIYSTLNWTDNENLFTGVFILQYYEIDCLNCKLNFHFNFPLTAVLKKIKSYFVLTENDTKFFCKLCIWCCVGICFSLEYLVGVWPQFCQTLALGWKHKVCKMVEGDYSSFNSTGWPAPGVVNGSKFSSSLWLNFFV